MNKNIKKLLILLAVFLLLMTSCNIADNPNEPETTEETFQFGIVEGMTLDKVVAILGEDYVDVGSGAIILEWILEEESQKVRVRFIRSDSNTSEVFVQNVFVEDMVEKTNN